ncbi:GFA family protein [Halomonas heilongjiangensis]|uniref:GFA family protein n=1 Tax=Halomonas heilongjiangensis TaxID=1387883 RepID=A0A2N7TJD4_9GAMM|nr:GFA family protein [Halomonas heilongjiangensis]PMR68305.1 GFA family protein [Halomonas heilongjiangensis]PXX93155.1 aldehyde-activating protein [Halomonas heilongjiangensis]
MSDRLYTASCLCGGVRIDLSAEPGAIDICHCSMCRKAQGSAFASNAPVDARAVSLVSGSELLASYASSPGHERVFCRKCGSPLFSRNARHPGVLRIRMGIVNEPVGARPHAHYHVESKANWWDINDDLPRRYAPNDDIPPGTE